MSLSRCMAETPSHHFTLWKAKFLLDIEREQGVPERDARRGTYEGEGSLPEFKPKQDTREAWHRLELFMKANMEKSKNATRRPN